jgi:hypothetical protein
MKAARLVLISACLVFLSASLVAQFSPRKDYVWARDVAGATMTLDGKMNESVWAKADSIVIRYGQNDGTPGGGWKIMNGSGDVTDPQNVVVKFLTDKAHNKLYIGIFAKDSSIGGSGWENSDGVLAGIYDQTALAASSLVTLQKDIFPVWGFDSLSSLVGGLPQINGALPSAGIVNIATTVQGTANSDTNGTGGYVADTSWTMEMAVSLDSLGYNANSATTNAVEMSICIWDADWPASSPQHIATKAWWGNEWGNNGGVMAGRVLMRSDVDVNTSVLPTYGPDMTIKNGANFPDIVVDGSLSDSIWNYVPSLDLQYGNATLRATYPKEGRSGQFAPKLNSTNGVIDPGIAHVKMFFQGDTLYVGADVSDQSILTYVSDDFFDGLQVSLNPPVDSLRDGVHQMAAQRFGVAPDSAVNGGAKALWDAVKGNGITPGFRYGAKLKSGSALNSTSVVSTGYTVEMAFDLTKFGYTAGSQNKTISVGLNYHDYDRTATDTSAYRDWWFREWPWASTPAFAVLNNTAMITTTGVGDVANVPRQFILYHNYPNPFNPATTIQFMLPDFGNVKIRVYDLLGRLVGVQDLVGQSSGLHQYVFDASKLASGVYYYNVEYVSARGNNRRMSPTEKMLLLK